MSNYYFEVVEQITYGAVASSEEGFKGALEKIERQECDEVVVLSREITKITRTAPLAMDE